MPIIKIVKMSYRENILGINFSKNIVDEIEILVKEFSCIGETYYSLLIDILRLAFNKKEKIFIQTDSRSKEKLIWEVLSKLHRRDKITDFEERFLAPEIVKRKKNMMAILRQHFIERLSPNTRKRFHEIENEGQRFIENPSFIELGLSKEELQHILNYSDTKFSKYENDVFNEVLRRIEMADEIGDEIDLTKDAVKYAYRLKRNNIGYRTAANESVKKYFSTLSPGKKKKKIDSIRNTIKQKFQKRRKKPH